MDIFKSFEVEKYAQQIQRIFLWLRHQTVQNLQKLDRWAALQTIFFLYL